MEKYVNIWGRNTIITPAITPYRISFGSPHSLGMVNIKIEDRIMSVNQENIRGAISKINFSSIPNKGVISNPITAEIRPTNGGIANKPKGGFSHFIEPSLGTRPITIPLALVSNAAFLWKA